MFFVGIQQGFNIVQLQAGYLDIADFDTGINSWDWAVVEDCRVAWSGVCLYIIPIGEQWEFLQGNPGFQKRCLFFRWLIFEDKSKGLAVECAFEIPLPVFFAVPVKWAG